MRAYLAVLLLGLATTTSAQPPLGSRPSWNGCGSPDLQSKAAPSADGPAHLLRFDCLTLPRTRLHYEPPVVSPDGSRFLVYGYTRGVFLGTLESGTASQGHAFDPTFVQFTGLPFARSTFLFQWASNSRSIWAADQPTGPGHFAAGPLKPVLIASDGTEQDLPPLLTPAGPLDGLMWIGGDGIALAQFGTRGGYYKPEHPDPDPTLAFVDVKHGKILNRFRLTDFPKAVSAQGHPMVPLHIATVRLAGGRASTVLQWPSGYSLNWMQDSEPREISLPKLSWGTKISLASDGRRLLLSYPLSASGVICEIWTRTPCPPPTPTTGKLAGLVDIETGKMVWEISDTATQFEGYSEPAISPDGRYALIGIPHRKNHNIALVSMTDGRILQTVPSIWSTWSVTFGADSRHFYVSGGAFAASYEIDER